jgi:hypothetical protein
MADAGYAAKGAEPPVNYAAADCSAAQQTQQQGYPAPQQQARDAAGGVCALSARSAQPTRGNALGGGHSVASARPASPLALT